MRDTIDMAREAGWKDLRDYDSQMQHDFFMGSIDSLKAFEALVRADERALAAPVYVKTFHGGKPWPLHPEPVQEPVYHLRQFGDVTKEQLDRYMATGDINAQPAPVQERNFCERCGKRLGSGIHTCTPPAAPVQEPVAWPWHQAPVKTSWGHDMVVADLAIDKDNTVSVYCERDYTAKVEAMFTPPAVQRQWVGLTDDEMQTTHWSPDFRAGAKWAEAKLKEKNT